MANSFFPVNSPFFHKLFGEGIIVHSDEKYFDVAFRNGHTARFDKNAAFLGGNVSSVEIPNDLKIQSVLVEDLFGYINYNLAIANGNCVSILTAPNGCGKTTIFKFLDFILSPRPDKFEIIKDVPFSRFSCVLSDGHILSLMKKQITPGKDGEQDNRFLTRYNMAESFFGSAYDFVFEISQGKKNIKPISFIDQQMNLRDRRNHAVYDYDDEYEYRRHGTRMMERRIMDFCVEIDSVLIQNRCKVKIDFIGANRLQKVYDPLPANGSEDLEIERNRRRDQNKIDFLRKANQEMTGKVRQWVDAYNKRVTDAKNRLPAMYLDAQDTVQTDFIEFKKRWDAYHRELEKFCALGILESGEAMINDARLEEAYRQKSAFLTTYLDAFEGTLAPLQQNYRRVKLFADIFHKRNEITRKSIKFTPNGIVIQSNGQIIDIDCLSSGEKNDFVMFYRLIFNAVPGGIVLIDEPEISLHIEWQEDYLDRLIDICRINGFQAIIATHSPNIVNDHFDLFIDKR